MKLTKITNYSDKDNNRIICSRTFESPQIWVEFKGKNNVLEISDGANIGHLYVKFTQNNGSVKIGKCRSVGYIRCGDGCSVEIGDGFTSDGGTNFLTSEGTSLKIGKDCMFARNVEIRTDDTHPVFDTESGGRVNESKSIEIGDHVWLANSVRVLKGAKIGVGCYVGVYSIVNKVFPNNCGIVGAPAKICAVNRTWGRKELTQWSEDDNRKTYAEINPEFKGTTFLDSNLSTVRDYLEKKRNS